MEDISTLVISSNSHENKYTRSVDFENNIQIMEYNKNFKSIFCCSCIDVSMRSPHISNDYRAMTIGGSIIND